LAEKKKLVVAGPMMVDTTLRGIFIFDAADQAEVDSLVRSDPAIHSGHLAAEIYPWYSQRGTTLP
jgi:uncharacterized protein